MGFYPVFEPMVDGAYSQIGFGHPEAFNVPQVFIILDYLPVSFILVTYPFSPSQTLSWLNFW